MVLGEGVHYQVRLGINLGPVKIIDDINGQRNIIGDGINVAQRIMDFAMPNQLLVSRSFFEVTSCLSDNHLKMFSYLGSRKDKHVREHEVYELSSLRARSDSESPVASQREPTSESAVIVEQPGRTILGPCHFIDEILKAIEIELAVYVGPMAKVLVRKAVDKVDSLDSLYQTLAKDIPGEKEQCMFLDNCSHLQRDVIKVVSATAYERWRHED